MTDVEKGESKRERDNRQDKSYVNVGQAYPRWRELSDSIGLKMDTELAVLLLDRNSPLNLAGMALERYIAVCKPLHHVHICTLQRTYGLIALIWAVSFLPAVTDVIFLVATQPLSIFLRNVICYPSNIFSTPFHKTHRTVVQGLLLCFVFLTVLITYLKVLCAARAASGLNQASARNASNTILLHGVQLLICMSSFIAPFINIILVTAWPKKRTTILFTTYLVTGILPRLLSPLIYGIRDKTFSCHVRMHFCTGCYPAEKRVNPMGPQRRSKKVSH